MFLQRLWQWRQRPTVSRKRAAPRQRARLGVECLEGREVPATFAAATVPELIAGITAANQSPEADTITLVPGKVFTLTEVNNTDQGATGLPVIAAAGGGLTIVGNGDVIERSTAKGTPAFRLLNVAAGASLTLQNLTLQGGYAMGGTYVGWLGTYAVAGAAVYNAGSVRLTGVTVQNNTAQGGDGVYPMAAGGHAAGGGIYSSGTLLVENSTIRNNLA